MQIDGLRQESDRCESKGRVVVKMNNALGLWARLEKRISQYNEQSKAKVSCTMFHGHLG